MFNSCDHAKNDVLRLKAKRRTKRISVGGTPAPPSSSRPAMCGYRSLDIAGWCSQTLCPPTGGGAAEAFGVASSPVVAA